jgi:hypothetical protein
MDLENKPNSELMILLKELEAAHEATKTKIFKELDELDILERKYQKIKNILNQRLH